MFFDRLVTLGVSIVMTPLCIILGRYPVTTFQSHWNLLWIIPCLLYLSILNLVGLVVISRQGNDCIDWLLVVFYLMALIWF